MKLEQMPLPTLEALVQLKVADTPAPEKRLNIAVGAGLVVCHHLQSLMISLPSQPGQGLERVGRVVDAAVELLGVLERLRCDFVGENNLPAGCNNSAADTS